MKERVYIIYFIISVSIISCIISLLVINGCFDPKIIAEKYCYLYAANDRHEKYQPVIAGDNEKIGRDVAIWYQMSLDTNYKDTTLSFVMSKNTFYIPRFLKVKIIGHSSDSSLVKVWAVWSPKATQFHNYNEEGYVPSFTLHDTLPTIDTD